MSAKSTKRAGRGLGGALPPSTAIVPDARPVSTLETKMAVRTGSIRRSYEKIGNCEQSSSDATKKNHSAVNPEEIMKSRRNNESECDPCS